MLKLTLLPGLSGGNALRLTPPPFLLLPPLRGGEEQVGDEVAQQFLALLRLQCGKVFGYLLRQFFRATPPYSDC